MIIWALILILLHIFLCFSECTAHIAPRHHVAIFFGLFFGISDYIYTGFVPAGEVPSTGVMAMSKGSALSAMLWSAIIVYTVDRRWGRAAIFCCIAAFFAGIGIIHQLGAAFDEQFREGTVSKESSAFEYMMGYLSMAGLCLIYLFLQKYAGKKVEEGEKGFEEDHGYHQPIDEPGVDDMFATWWDPAERALELANEEDEELANGEDEEDLPKEETMENFVGASDPSDEEKPEETA